MKKRVLLAGESWMKHTIHVKGFDSFTTSEYEEGAGELIAALEEGGHDVTFLPNHLASEQFPSTEADLARYDVVFLSDIGSNTLLLAPDTFNRSRRTVDRTALLARWVSGGGALAMIGGYMTFSGIDGKGRWGKTALAPVLPVRCLDGDDRVEIPHGVVPDVLEGSHPLFDGIGPWPFFLGYNRTELVDGALLAATINGDPFIALRQVGKGRTAAFASDCAPHWGPPEFLRWEGYRSFWNNLVAWLTA